MPKLVYISVVRFPTEKAHGLQIAQNCEAFADSGYNVELWVSRRFNTPEMQQINDSHAHYGVAKNFTIHRISCLDLYPLLGGNEKLERIAFYLQILTYSFFMFLRLFWTRPDIIYSRDEDVLFPLTRLIPASKLAYEAHIFSQSGLGRWWQTQIVQHVGSTIAITERLAQDLIDTCGAPSERVIVAHDGIRAARFANPLSQEAARAQIGWSKTAFIVGFVGRLHMIGQDKGISTLIAALAQCENMSLAIVGGPVEMAESYRQEWLARGLPAKNFLYAGQVKPDAVPLYLSAFDVCAMPHPFTTQFAYYTSPLKLFEYMASGCAIVASDLPAWSNVVQHEKHALLVPPEESAALAQALQRLQTDSALREQLGQSARERVFAHYTWSARAQAIKAHLERPML